MYSLLTGQGNYLTIGDRDIKFVDTQNYGGYKLLWERS